MLRGMGYCLVMLALLAACGCGNREAKEMAGSGPLPPWEAQDQFRDSQGMAIGYPAAMNDWKAVKKAASSQEFKDAVAKIEQSTVPSAYRGKDAYITSLKELIQAAESGTEEDVKAKYEAYLKASENLAK